MRMMLAWRARQSSGLVELIPYDLRNIILHPVFGHQVDLWMEYTASYIYIHLGHRHRNQGGGGEELKVNVSPATALRLRLGPILL